MFVKSIDFDTIQIVNRAVQLQPSTAAASQKLKGGRALPKVTSFTICMLQRI